MEQASCVVRGVAVFETKNPRDLWTKIFTDGNLGCARNEVLPKRSDFTALQCGITVVRKVMAMIAFKSKRRNLTRVPRHGCI
jgi:hypothetical protein